MGIARTFAKNAFFQIGTNLAVKLTSLFLVVYLTVLLSPYDFGIYMWAVSMALMVDVFADFGTVASMIKFVNDAIAKASNSKAAAAFKYIFKIRLVALVIVTVVLLIFANPITTYVFGKPYLTIPLQFSAVLLLFYSFSNYLMNLFMAIKKNEYIFLVSIVQCALKIALMIGLVIMLNSFFGALIGYAAALAVTAGIFLFFILRKFKFFLTQKDSVEKPRILRYAKYAMFSSLALIFLVNLDILLISALLPIENVGFYSIAMSWVAAAASLFPMFIIFPILSELASMKSPSHLRDSFRIFFKYLVFVLAPVSFGLAFFSTPLINFFYAGEYEFISAQILFVLAFSIVFSGFANFMMNLFGAIERTDINARIFALAVAFNIILNLTLIPIFGVIGVAYTNVLTYVFVTLIFFALMKRVSKISLRLQDFFRPFIASAIIFIILITIVPSVSDILEAILYGIIALAAYLAVQFAIKGIDIQEVKHLVARVVSRK